MARTVKGSKGCGYEYWGKRPFCGWTPARVVKRMMHQLERQLAKRALQRGDDLPKREAF